MPFGAPSLPVIRVTVGLSDCLATMNTRRLRCGADTDAAEVIDQSAEYPRFCRSAATSLMAPDAARPRTFSTTTVPGFSAAIASRMVYQRPDRDPSSPARFPARLKSWQGNPPHSTSIASAGFQVVPVDGGDVAEVGNIRPVVGQHFGCGRVDLAVPCHMPAECGFYGHVEAAGAAE